MLTLPRAKLCCLQEWIFSICVTLKKEDVVTGFVCFFSHTETAKVMTTLREKCFVKEEMHPVIGFTTIGVFTGDLGMTPAWMGRGGRWAPHTVCWTNICIFSFHYRKIETRKNHYEWKLYKKKKRAKTWNQCYIKVKVTAPSQNIMKSNAQIHLMLIRNNEVIESTYALIATYALFYAWENLSRFHEKRILWKRYVWISNVCTQIGLTLIPLFHKHFQAGLGFN